MLYKKKIKINQESHLSSDPELEMQVAGAGGARLWAAEEDDHGRWRRRGFGRREEARAEVASGVEGEGTMRLNPPPAPKNAFQGVVLLPAPTNRHF